MVRRVKKRRKNVAGRDVVHNGQGAETLREIVAAFCVQQRAERGGEQITDTAGVRLK